MVEMRLYHYYRQGVCACPIYIIIAINTFKVLMRQNDNRCLIPRFPRYVKVYGF